MKVFPANNFWIGIVFVALSALVLLPAAADVGQQTGSDATGWSYGATAYIREYRTALRTGKPLLVYVASSRYDRLPDQLTHPTMQRVLTRMNGVVLNPDHGPAAQRIVAELRGTKRGSLHVMFPGTGNSLRRIVGSDAAAVNVAVAGWYRSQASQFAHVSATNQARRAQAQAQSFAAASRNSATLH